MNDAELIAGFRIINERLFAEAKHALGSHGPDHHERVCHYALRLADEIGKPVDREVLIAAAFLHDMSAYYPDLTGEDYHDHDAPLAEKVLRENHFNEAKIPLVLECIAKHGSDPKFKSADEPLEVTILRDADKLDVFGPLGVARIIMARALKKDTLAQIVTDFYANGHLQRKFDSITLPQAKAMAEEGFQYSREFFRKMAQGMIR